METQLHTEPAAHQSDDEFLAYLAAGGRLSSPENATPRYRGELMRLMSVFVDSEMAGAAGFADCINLAPGLKERMIAARIVLEKFGHADRILRVMETFGANTNQYVSAHPWAARLDRNTDLGTRRIEGDMRLNVFHYPIYGWVDAVTMNFLMGRASVIQLEELTSCSYQPLADTLLEIVPVEQRHATLGEAGLRLALEGGADPVAAQASINYWYPRVAATFGRAVSGHADSYRRFGLRRRDNEEMLAQWAQLVDETLRLLHLAVPGTTER
jgi:ring-1,2-phenylacetyl-CoA epoxidase subunit PaaA